MGLSRTVSEINGDSGQKSQVFPTRRACNLMLRVMEFVTGYCSKEIDGCPYTRWSKVWWYVHSLTLNTSVLWPDGGQKWQYRSLHAVHAHVRFKKNETKSYNKQSNNSLLHYYRSAVVLLRHSRPAPQMRTFEGGIFRHTLLPSPN